jgi:hypothetical protein
MTAVRRSMSRRVGRLGVAGVALTVGVLGWALVHRRVNQDLIVGLCVVLSALPALRTVDGVVRRRPGRARRWWFRPLLAAALMLAATLVYAGVVG